MLCCELFLGKPGPLVPGPGADSPIQKLEIQKSTSPAVAGRKATPPKDRRSAHLSSRGSAEGHRCNVLCILLTPTVALKSFEKKAYYISFLEPMYILGPPGA